MYLAQRFQVLEKLSPVDAGIRLIPYSALATVGTAVSNLACLRGRIPFVYLILFGSVLQTVGMALFAILPQTDSFPSAGYGYEVIAGTGIGVTIGICVLAVPYVVETRDLGMSPNPLLSLVFNMLTLQQQQLRALLTNAVFWGVQSALRLRLTSSTET